MAGIAAIYARISEDATAEGLGVQRQETDCRKKIEQLGLSFDEKHLFVDNDRGASNLSKKPRPQYEAMLDAVRAGGIDVIVAYSNSRLTRRPAQWVELITLANSGALQIKTCVTGSYDLTTADGRAVALTVAAWDAAEAERTGERVRRAAQQRAEMGIPKRGRYRTFGFSDDFEVIEEEAAHIRDAFERVIHGESLQSIANLWHANDVTMGNGRRVQFSTVQNIVRRPLYAALATYKGEVVGKSKVFPIVSEAVFYAAQEVLDGNAKPRAGKNARRYLLAGLVQCGLCGSVMSGSTGTKNKSGNRTHAYICRKVMGGCGGMGIQGPRLEQLALSLVKSRLTIKDWAGPPEEPIDYQGQIDALDEQMELARSDVREGRLTFLDIRDTLTDLSAKKRALERLSVAQIQDRDDYLPGRSWDEFTEASLSEQMATVGAVAKGIVINKATGTQWDASRVVVYSTRGNEIQGDQIKIQVSDSRFYIAGFKDEKRNETKKSRPVKNEQGKFVGSLPAQWLWDNGGMEKYTVSSERTKWVFTYVPAGETVKVLDDDVDYKPFRYEHDVLQGHVIDTRNQFMPQTAPKRFLNDTKNVTPAALHKYFGVTKDSLSQDALAGLRDWVAKQVKTHSK